MAINTYHETDLHRELKNIYTQKGESQEVPIAGFICDILKNDNSIVEIQTKKLSALTKKLKCFCKNHKVTVVYPIIAELQIEKDGKTRKSPKRGKIYDIFSELTKIYTFFDNENFTLEVLLITAQEFRTEKTKGKGWRKNYSITGRKLCTIREKYIFNSKNDFLKLLPPNLPKEFTTQNLEESFGREKNIAVWVLCKMGILKKVGKQGRYFLYKQERKRRSSQVTKEARRSKN